MLTPIDLFSFHSLQCSKNACQRITYLLNLNQDSYSLLLKIKITFTPIVHKALYKKGERIIIFQHHLLEEELHTCPPRTNSSTIVFSFAFVVTEAKRLLPYLTAETALNASKATLPVGEESENSAPFDMSAGYTFRKITDQVTLNTIEALPECFNSFDMATYAAPENPKSGLYPNAEQFIFLPTETAAGGILRYNTVDKSILILA